MKILAVDDDEFILEILEAAVTSIGGHEIELASNAIDAMKIMTATDSPFDCFLLDIQMPEMTGIELCSRIRKHPFYTETPILMITAMSDKNYVDDAFAAGATDYITKPFDIIELNSRIDFAEKMSQRSQAEFPTAQTLNMIVGQLMGDNVYDLTDVIPVLDIDNALHLHAFENYLQQLKRAQFSNSAIFAVGVRNIETIHARSSGREFGDHINDIADIISQCVRNIPGFFTYMGNGVFCCVIEGKNKEVLNDLPFELETETGELGLVYRNGQSVDVNYVVGTSVTPSFFARGNVSEVFEKAIQKMNEMTHGRPKAAGRLRWVTGG